MIGLQTTPVTVSSVLALMEPLTATFVGVVFFGDRLGLAGALGAVLLLSAVLLLASETNGRLPSRPHPEPPPGGGAAGCPGG